VFVGTAAYDTTQKAFTFPGTAGNYITRSQIGNSAGAWVHSFSTWVNTNDTTYNHIFSIGADSDNATSTFRFDGGASDPRTDFRWFFYGNDVTWSYIGNLTKTWVHLAGVYDGGAVAGSRRLWVDGVEAIQSSAAAIEALALTANTQLTLGERSNRQGTQTLNGKISNFKLYDTALTSSDVNTLYQMGRCDEGGHVVNFSKTRVGIGLGDGEVPRRDLEVRGKMRVGTGLHNFKGSASSGTSANEPTLEVSDLGGSRASPIATVLQITNAHPGGSDWNTSSSFAKLAFATVDASGPGDGGIVGSIGMTCTAGGGGDDSRLIFATDSGEDHSEKMCIDTSGNVGIGTTNPKVALHVSATEGRFAIADASEDDCDTNAFNAGFFFVDNTWTGSVAYSGNPANGMGFCIAHISSSSKEISMRNMCGEISIGTRNVIRAITIDDDGNVGIGLQTPGYFFHVFRDAELYGNSGDEDTVFYLGQAGQMTIQRKSGSTLKAEINSNMSSNSPAWNYYKTSSVYWRAGFSATNISGSNNNDFKFLWLTTVKAYIDASDGSVEINFTGQHRTFIDGVPTSESGDFIGLIVCADKNKYMKMSKGVEMGSNAITINESLPIVSLSNAAYDKKCFGVISDAEDHQDRKDSFGNIVTVSKKELGDTRVYINSVGEGAIWVTNINGPLESGDYITTSNVAGYGQRQDSEFLANYTVAKITMDCDFEPVTQPIQQIRKELGDVNYWVKTTYESVSEEEYSNLIEENRRTTTETVYTNENNQISVGEYSNLESNIQSTYSELTQTLYQNITKDESKTEQEGYELEVRQEMVNVLDEHSQIQWEDHATETEKAYKIRYLDANGVITDEASAVHTAAFVGCTYHCG